jgi:general secretion pathway protein L
MIKKRKPETAAPGARLDLLLPRAWPQDDAPIAWRWRTRAGDTRTGVDTLDRLPNVGATPIHVWTRASATLLTQTSLPTKSRAKLAQALPYALEDQLLDDPLTLHFAWRREDDGTLYVAVTAKEQLRSWLEPLRRAGLTPTALCPATLLVPWSPGCWSACFDDDELLVRTGPAGGFTCALNALQPPPLLVSHLADASAGEPMPEFLLLFQPPAGFDRDAWSAALGIPVRVEAPSLWEAPVDSAPALNLLQGEFAARSEARQHLRPLRPAAAILAIWLIGTLAFDGVEWWQLKRRHTDITREMTALLQSAFPDIKNPDFEPQRQMQSNLDRLQARGGLRAHDLLPLLARAAPALRADSRARLRALRYNDRSLTLDVITPDAAALEQLRQALQATGLQAETVTSTARANEIDGKLRVKPPATISSAKP